jgi:2,4-dienoyl-CoA reductase-like NADH-dependent reductase (Old Yellow Enzyme family)
MTAARKSVSPDFPIGIRLSDEFASGGLPVEDCVQVVHWLEADRLIDFTHGSQGSYMCLPNMLPAVPHGWTVPPLINYLRNSK